MPIPDYQKAFKEASVDKTGTPGKQSNFQTAHFCGVRHPLREEIPYSI